MRVEQASKTDTLVSLTVTAEPTELEAIKPVVVRHLGQHTRVSGFRTGKAPLGIIEKQLDQTQLQSEFLSEAVTQLYRTALEREKLRVVSQPQVTIKKFVPFSELEFTAEVEIIGPVKLPDYTKFKKVKPIASVTTADVNEVIKSLRQRAATTKDVDRPAKNGDQVIIDFKGTDTDGQPVSGADGTAYPLILGSNRFIPGFEQNLVGLKPGEQKAFSLTFPKDYGVRALADKKVNFSATVKQVQELTEPTVDDVFAKKISPFQTLHELKADIKKQLTLERQRESDRQFESELVQEIAGNTQLAVPKALVDEQLDRLEQEERQNLVYRGQSWEEHLQTEGLTAEAHREQKRSVAEEQVKAGLLLAEIANREKIKVTPEELEIRLQLLKNQYKDAAMQAELDKPANREEVANRLLTEKTLAKLVGYATK